MSTAPLRLAYVLSLLLFSIFVGYVLYVLYGHFVLNHPLVPGWTSIMSAISIFGTIQMLLFGVLGEYVGRIYEQVKQRPLYIVKEIVRSTISTRDQASPALARESESPPCEVQP